ncbi:nicalin [Artemisia annua]|uniref:Nicalin n=1 Tax=Artemisia annua TaxID=35608 RepID=A0A2U1PIP3_ARTAN|nr:nicalin [Artemisia annua]
MESSSSSLKKMYSMIIYIILIAAVSLSVELCDASTVVVDVYRLIQYDIAGSPFGSRLASLNHHAASSSLLLSSTTDLSRAVLVPPLTELNHHTSFINGPDDVFDLSEPSVLDLEPPLQFQTPVKHLSHVADDNDNVIDGEPLQIASICDMHAVINMTCE